MKKDIEETRAALLRRDAALKFELEALQPTGLKTQEQYDEAKALTRELVDGDEAAMLLVEEFWRSADEQRQRS